MSITEFSIHSAWKLANKIQKLMPTSFVYGAFNTRLRSECQLLESKTITKLLSSLLPIVSDSTIFEIDDIIYVDDSDSDVTAGISLTSEKNVAYLVRECFINFLKVFFDEEKCCRSVEMVFLQLLELVPRETMSNNAMSAFGKDILRLVLNMSKYTSEERFLKVMKIIVYKDINWFEKTMECDLNGGGFIEMEEFMAPLWLPNFPKTLDFDNVHEKRRALWLSEQSEAILTKLNLDIFENDYPMMTYFKTHKIGKKVHYDWMFIGLLKFYLDKDNNTRMSFCINHLNNYFSSARDDEEKMQRIQDFIRGMCSRDGLKYDWNITDIHDGVKEITKYSKFIVDSLFHLFQEIDKNPLMQLRRHTYYDIGSYLSEDNNCSAYLTFKEETVELVEKNFGSSSYSDDDDDDDESSHESFCEGQKVSFYNKFMKGLQLLDILHTTWLMMDDVSKFKNIHPGIVTEIFRPSDSPVKQRINEFINDPSKRGRVDWWIPFLLMKCPFLIQSYQRESHMKNLIKLLIGKNIDKASEEMLYMTINTKRYFRSSKRRSRFYKYLPEDPVSDDEDDFDDSEDDDVDDDE